MLQTPNYIGNIMKIDRRNFFALTFAAIVMLPLSTNAGISDGWFGVSIKADTKGNSFNPTVRSLQVIKVFPSSPAADAGLVAGDFIVVIQGIVVAGAQANDLKVVMRKAVGEKIKIKIQRGTSKPFDVRLTAISKPSGV
jgi:C-terminal processing protease CtpA/Prc